MNYFVTFLLSLSALAACSDSDDSSSPAPIISISGTLQIDPDISTPEGVEAGQPIEGAQVFIRDFPDQTTETDELGAFVLNVDLSQANTAASLTESSYEIFMWYTVTEDEDQLSTTRLGASRTFTSAVGGTTDIETINLVYTTGLHIYLYDSVNRDTPLTGCSISLPGFESKVVSAEIGNGRYDVDYLPESDYTLIITCTDYNQLEEEVTVEIGSVSNDWDTYNYYLESSS